MLIALDIDGVLVNLDAHMRAVGQQLFGIPMKQISPAYAFHKRYEGLTLEMEVALWEHMEKAELWATAPLYDDVPEALKLLRDAGVGTMCISAAPNRLTAQRIESLKSVDLHETPVICTGRDAPTTLADKRIALTQFAPDGFVDDQLHNVVQAAECGIPFLSWVDLGDEQIHFDKEWHEVAHHRGESLLEVAQHLVDQLNKVPLMVRKRRA